MPLSWTIKELRDYLNRELRKITETIRRPFGIPSEREVKSDYRATWGQLLRVDSSSGNVDVYLPRITGDLLGRTIVVKKISDDANTVSVYPASGDTVDKETVYAMSNQGHAAIFIAGKGQWDSV